MQRFVDFLECGKEQDQGVKTPTLTDSYCSELQEIFDEWSQKTVDADKQVQQSRRHIEPEHAEEIPCLVVKPLPRTSPLSTPMPADDNNEMPGSPSSPSWTTVRRPGAAVQERLARRRFIIRAVAKTAYSVYERGRTRRYAADGRPLDLSGMPTYTDRERRLPGNRRPDLLIDLYGKPYEDY